jgi:hypothetical protein
VTQLGLAFAIDMSAEPTATPAGRAARRPDRSHVQQEPQQPTPAVDFTQWLSPEEMQRAHAYAEQVVREIQQRPAFLRLAGTALARLLRRYAAGLLLAGGKLLALAERIEAAGDAEVEPEPVEPLDDEPHAVEPAAAPEPPAPPKRGPGRPRGPRAPGGPMPPPALRARPAVESAAPVPAAPRKQQPTAEQVLEKYRGLRAPKRAGSAE